MRNGRSLSLAALLCAALVFAQASARRPLKIEDMHAFQTVGDPQISPDGKWVAYTVSTVDVPGDKSDTDVWMASWDGARQMRITSSTESENAPRWSPDGRYLSFLSSRPGKARGSQVWLLDRTGGEAEQLTDVKGRITAYEWSPDSKKILLTMSERAPGDPEDPPAGGAAGGRGAPAPKPIVIDRYKFKQDVVGYLTARPARFHIFDLETKKAEALTPENLEVGAASWSPDGRSIAFLGREGKEAERLNNWNVYAMGACSCDNPNQLTVYDGVKASASRSRPEWSPDGKSIVFLQSTGAKQGAYNMNRLAVVPSRGGDPAVLTPKLDRGVSSPRFSTDGKYVLFLVSDDRWEYPARVPVKGGEVEKLAKGPGVISTLEQGDDGKLAVIAAGDHTSGEIYAFENGQLRALTHHNDKLFAQLKLGAVEEFTCEAKDGNEVHGLIVKPPDYQAGK